MKTLRLLLGDQLNLQHSWFKQKDDSVYYVLMEMRQETDYTKHHIQKVVAFFLAMRAFAEKLEASGHQVIYLRLDDTENTQSLNENLQNLIQKHKITHFAYQLPDEYRLDEQLQTLAQTLQEAQNVPTTVVDTEHFLVKRRFVADFFQKKKTFLLESFYRQVRKDFDILMDAGGQPEGGKWNYDGKNRNRFDGKVPIPEAKTFDREVSSLVELLKKEGVETIGNIDPKKFTWAITREEGLKVLDYFCEHLLPHFGTYQDALEPNEPFLFHSRLSFLMNAKILSPLEVVQAAVAAWRRRSEEISLPQIEGFVRQIIGWREYVRGIYWAKMPDFADLNFFNHERPLPNFYWTGNTKMACLKDAIQNSLDKGYAHHIQRLMVTGNFALLAGVHPDEVDQWYLGIYLDAIEWVEITNTRGMSQFADGGIVGTKPYVSSANYIHKMGRHCKGCQYDHKKKTGENACPFNSLYWHFHARNRELLEKNPRIGMVYRTWDKMNSTKKNELLDQAEEYLTRVEEL